MQLFGISTKKVAICNIQKKTFEIYGFCEQNVKF